MKKQLLLAPILAGLSWIALSGYSSGPFNGGAGNRTGSNGTQASCGSPASGCHNDNTTNTTGTLAVTTSTGGAVTQYTPGTTYKITIAATNTASLPKFGFQASSVKAAATGTQAGSFAATTSNVRISNPSALQMAEHSSPIAGITAGNYSISFNWTAPPAGTGTVRFYSIVNAVNGQTNTSGDQPNALPNIDLPEAPSGVGVAAVKPVALSVYPNPATDELHIGLSNAGKFLTHIFDMGGRIVAAQAVTAINGEAHVDVSMMKPGNYYILAEQDRLRYGALFQKQ